MTLSVVSPAALPTASIFTDRPTDINVSRLRIQSTLAAVGILLDVTNVLADGSATDSYTAAPQLVFTALDRDYNMLDSGIFDDTVEVTLDGIPYRLVEVEMTSTTFQLQLTWEHKIIALLRQRTKFLSVQRGSMTRAQFIELLLTEILAEFPDVIYVCPEVNKVQQIAASKKSGRSLTAKSLASKKKAVDVKSSGFTRNELPIKDWTGEDIVLSPEQLANAATLMQTAAQCNAPIKAVLALMEACIVEPERPFGNPNFGDHSSTGILQILASTAAGLGINPLDIVESANAFLVRGFTGAGGAISLAKNHPTWTAGHIAQAVQGSGDGARYDAAGTGARTVIEAYGGVVKSTSSGSSIILSGDVAVTTQFNFTRGQPGQKEDSYTCAMRLAAQVQWRFFVSGAKTVYFCTDDDLLTGQQVFTIGRDTVGVAQPTGTVEKGGRTVVDHGHRIPKASEGQVAVRVRRWECGVGDVLNIEDYGPFNGKWLIYEVDHDLFDRSGTLYFQTPQAALPEPAATTSTNTVQVAPGTVGATSANVVDRVYAAAQAISARNLPYVYGGGHTATWLEAMKATGLDCSGSVGLALYSAGLMAAFPGPITAADFDTWGQPGRGSQMTVWYSGGHVFIQFYNLPANRFDTVPGGSGGLGPHLRYTKPGDPGDTWEAIGFTPRHWPGY